MNEPLKILKWDYVLGHDSQKIPQLTFKPSPEFISMAKLNNNNLYINIADSGDKILDSNNFRAVVDKSTDIVGPDGMVVGFNISQGCQCDYSDTTLLYTLTIPLACYEDKISGGTFTLMPEHNKKQVNKKKVVETEPVETEPVETEPDTDGHELETPIAPAKPESGLETLPLVLIGGIMVTGAALAVFLIRR